MANLTTPNGRQLSVIDVAEIVKAITPRSFEKTFEGMKEVHIATAFKVCIDGLSYEQIQAGIAVVRDNGFCPDPAMFRKWCLGITGFGSEQQRAVDSFKGKRGALANILNWLSSKGRTEITNAEKQAYDRCYNMFADIQWAKDVNRAQYYAYEAFKDNYVDVVRELVEQGIAQDVWAKPKAVEGKSTPVITADKPKGLLKNQTPEQQKISARTTELMASGLGFGDAFKQAQEEITGAVGSLNKMGEVA
ncbi:hypothetical protein [Acinetobacter larvae]|uniref:Uncharacterized protein n=1 Tax=Acinetobacter larvae TaxID=1789224 RepID=A0A1B2LZI8_9GAMM|nr:hypothetical protein [Acinetobacter larvae]AOA58193.1 hypothetical protein BFG52_07400 [Acinetobacter larvae]